jgi:hypothetical protein
MQSPTNTGAAQLEFFINREGQSMGPWSLAEIVKRLDKNELLPTDYLYDESKSDWVLLMEFAPVIDQIKSRKPAAPPPPKRAQAQYESVDPKAKQEVEGTPSDEWFILKWDNRYGPFSYYEMVRMLQEKSIFEFDYAWKTGMEAWARVAEVTAFAEDKIRDLREVPNPALQEVFFRRRHMRTNYNGSIIVHDNKSVWKGESIEISEGGAGIVMNNAMVLPGQTLYVHFKAGDNVPPFNAVVEVVSKKFVKGVKDKSAPITYGVKFVRINRGVQDAIKTYVAGKLAS